MAAMSEIVVPDIAGALVGSRCWGLAKTEHGIQLASHGGAIWPAGAPLEASCDKRKRHVPPGEHCTCGVYALSEQGGYPYYAYDGPGYAVFGQVYLWGDVIRGTRGYRAHFAYPKALYLAYKDWRFAQPLRDSYGVPVRLHNPYTKAAD